jgi:hypothetical protein
MTALKAEVIEIIVEFGSTLRRSRRGGTFSSFSCRTVRQRSKFHVRYFPWPICISTI